jgi:hypothetical protein
MRKIFFTLPLVFLILSAGCAGLFGSGKGTIDVTSAPPGAEVFLDSQLRGTTPAALTDVPYGQHVLEVKNRGYVTFTMTLTVDSTERIGVSATLVPETPPPQVTAGPAATGPSAPSLVSIVAGRESVAAGNPISFRGMAETGETNVVLYLQGPNLPEKGEIIANPEITLSRQWQYVYSVPVSLQPGKYTVTVTDSGKKNTGSVAFTVEKGTVSVAVSGTGTYTMGDMILFSGTDSVASGTSKLKFTVTSSDGITVFADDAIIKSDKTWSYSFNSSAIAGHPRGFFTVKLQDSQVPTASTTVDIYLQ